MEPRPSPSDHSGKVLESLKKYMVVEKTHITSWKAWALIGLTVGISAGVVLVANRTGEVEKGSTAPPVAVQPPVSSSSIPLVLSLALEKLSYELDEQLSGTFAVINFAPGTTTVSFALEFYRGQEQERAPSVVADYDATIIPPGTTTVDLRGVGGLRIPANPDLVGAWRMVIRQKGHESKGATAVPAQAPFTVVTPNPVTITVDGASARGTMGSVHGFVLVPRPVTDATRRLVAALKPQQWRVFLSGDVPDALSYRPKKITYSTEADYYILAYRTKYNREPDWDALYAQLPAILPWENDYALYRQYVTGIVNAVRTNKLPPVYLGWWNEPNFPNTGQWFGTNRQMFDTFKVFHDTVRAINQTQKIEGPTAMTFDEPFLRAFLDYTADNNLRLDVVSWHEYDPTDIARHVGAMRRWFTENPRYCKPRCPEIHINEFNAISHYFIPGWQGAYLANLENSGVDFAAGNSCFNIDLPNGQKINTCYDNYMGLFIEKDGTHNEVPQALYWVRRAYAEMQGNVKLSVVSSAERTVAMAAKSDAERTVRLLVSRHTCGRNGTWCKGGTFNTDEQKGPPVPVTLSVANFPYVSSGASVQAEIYRIPNQNVPGPFTEADLAKHRTIERVTVDPQGNVTIKTPQYEDGDAYYIVITP